MRIKKVGISLFVLVFALILPISSAFAGAGEWDYLGQHGLTIKTGKLKRTKHVHSGGGDFKVCNHNMGHNTLYYLYEYDPTNKDDYVGVAVIDRGKCHAFRGIGKFVDGSNRKAEFYVKAHVPSGGLAFERQVKYYD